MSDHRFGGDWTTEKLDRVKDYLVAYAKIFSENERARHLVPVYVDAFAGTGYRTSSKQRVPSEPMLEELAELDNQAFLSGSARNALEVEPPFQRYIFIERDAERSHELEKLKTEFPLKAARIQIVVADANRYLLEWCRRTDWRRYRAVVFLDPYGMQVDWSLLQAIAKTKAIDLWLLFPLGMAVNRLLPKNGPPSEPWAQALTRTFGTDEWRQAFYTRQTVMTLFGEEEVTSREATLAQIGTFFVSRLKTIFTGVAENPLPLLNSKQVPLYLLCFASGNPQGTPIALRIAQHILKR